MVPLPPLRDGARALPISSFRQSMPSFDTRCPGLHLQPGASVVLGCVGELPGCRCTDFNPRAPCGARRWLRPLGQSCQEEFQSTRPVWGATRTLPGRSPRKTRFQSTRPVWGATANLTILTRQICTKGTKEFLLGRKTHEERGKITQKLAYIHAFSAFFRCEGAGTFCALVLRTQ